MSQPATASLGSYRLLGQIGEGGMGVVHLAADANGRRVALKVLRPQVVGDEEGRRRLAREVSSLSQVRSPHVAEFLDADPWGPMPYVVTRYVPGHSLHEVVRRSGPLPAADLDHVGRGLLQAVRDVHAAGVLHRDVKPTNVVLEGRSPILIDFGLARLAEDPRLTTAGWLMGTPGYLAPEMLFGEPATHATDVHGWAATMAYAATGRPPYGTGHPMAILDRTRRGDVDLSEVAEPLRVLLAACLATEPVDRPTAVEVANELATLWARTGGAADGEAPTQALALAPTAAGDPTLPWQLAVEDDAATRTIPPPPPQPGPWPMVRSPDPTLVAGATRPPAPTRPPDPTRAVPLHPATVAAQPSPGGRWRTAGARVRRALILLALLAVVTLTFRLAPYLTAASVAVAVIGVRGLALAQEARRRRRDARGPRWSDTPWSVVGYPWHLVRSLAGSVVLLGTAATVMAGAVVGAAALGRPLAEGLLAAGALGGYLVWWGPAGERVRRPTGRLVSRLAGSPWVGWVLVAVLALVVGGLVLVAPQAEVSWVPAAGPPWSGWREWLDPWISLAA